MRKSRRKVRKMRKCKTNHKTIEGEEECGEKFNNVHNVIEIPT